MPDVNEKGFFLVNCRHCGGTGRYDGDVCTGGTVGNGCKADGGEPKSETLKTIVALAFFSGFTGMFGCLLFYYSTGYTIFKWLAFANCLTYGIAIYFMDKWKKEKAKERRTKKVPKHHIIAEQECTHEGGECAITCYYEERGDCETKKLWRTCKNKDDQYCPGCTRNPERRRDRYVPEGAK